MYYELSWLLSLGAARRALRFRAFADLASCGLQPEFQQYMTEAFKPLGVYIRFWGDGKPDGSLRQWFPIQGGSEHNFSVVMINTTASRSMGRLVVSIETQPAVSAGEL